MTNSELEHQGNEPIPLSVRSVSHARVEWAGLATCAKFSLKLADSTTIEFECDPVQLGSIQTDLQLLYGKAIGRITPTDLYGITIDVPFETDFGGTAFLHGKGFSGHFVFFFKTAGGQVLATGIGPNLAQLFHDQLHGGLSGLEQRPQPSERNSFSGMFIPGLQANLQEYIEEFGQKYPTDIIQQLGIFMVRANLLEKSMIKLLANVAGIKETVASALFYSTVNVRARITMVQAAVDAVKLDSALKDLIRKAMDAVLGVTQRRNSLVHGFWIFKKDKFEVEVLRTSQNRNGPK